MKFNYDFIKENIRVYNEAKSLLPIISQYENDEVSYNAMRSLKLEAFADFCNFLKSEKSNGFELIKAISFKELKEIIINKTKNERFKTLIKNISQKNFTKLLTEDAEKFDRYLNGRWISKPGYNNRGRRSYGKRSNENIEGLKFGFLPLLNWVISNEIETVETNSQLFQSFSSQDVYSQRFKWYKNVVLKIDTLPMREIDITSNLLNSLVNFIQESEIDFRKLNSDFIVETIQNKVKKLMDVPNGTTIVSLVDLKSDYGRQLLTKGKNYTVISSLINYGFIKVSLRDDTDMVSYHDYKLFEDVSLQRDMLLRQLGILD
jgi:hypothetical protein